MGQHVFISNESHVEPCTESNQNAFMRTQAVLSECRTSTYVTFLRGALCNNSAWGESDQDYLLHTRLLLNVLIQICIDFTTISGLVNIV